MRKIFSLLAVLLIVGVAYLEIKENTKDGRSLEFPNVKINETIIKVLVADDMQEQTQGLSDRPKLEKSEGMLFVFDTKQERSFWMKQMNFPLDIIWIEDDKIVNIHKNLPPEGDNPENHYASQFRINYVLEVNAGFVDEQKIKIGDTVQYKLIKN
ncbi:DUF192 domain-containing protein [Candidatus Parcubacteria bacterium]|nr:DUF192 domain-containing protein [Patescibacteria group bacterium]MBU4308981.1 DUF192 domain-containing protein [Patescibacteria group bacterium]MBU4431704.1 DUF192 domain-containing protein [Patescibacteria group bacterium]MBU4577341.1 DUF192 domain-containing protein [Patescibacteria group bacterium]MCG2697029.1 DUF192 domain-containing protein [Candidatus Parcubacteria bacterium]